MLPTERTKSRNIAKKLFESLLWIVGISLTLFVFLRYLLPFELPTEPYSLALLDRHGEKIGEMLSSEGLRHRPLEYSDIPEFTKKAVVALEDRRFESHFGIDPIGVFRALARNVSQGWGAEGASTVNSWLVRNALWIEKDRGLWRKIREGAYAMRIDGQHSKEKILSLYLNRISFGRLSLGISAAAESYFGKPLKNLTLAEQAALVSMAKNASKYDPTENPDAFRKRFVAVVETLATEGVLSETEKRLVLAERLSFPRQKNALPYVTDAIKSEKILLSPGRANRDFLSEGNASEFRTSFDVGLTKRLDRIGRSALSEIAWRNVTDYGILLVDRETKEILTLIGGADYESESGGQVNSVFAKRQVGSTVKPFTYLLAFQNAGIKPEDTVLDLPVSFQTAERTPYEPKNYSLSFRWPVTVAEALAGSLNVPAVKMAEKVGVGTLLTFLRSLGITTLTEDRDHYGLALTLGVGEIPLFELLRAFTVFSDAGNFCDFVAVTGKKPECRKAADPASALAVERILTNRSFKLKEFSALTALDFPDRYVFVKTGTSRNFRDNYAIGYTKKYLLAVWSGNKDGSNMKGVSGATWAWEIFSRIVANLEAPDGAPEEEKLVANETGHFEIVSPLPESRFRYDPSMAKLSQAIVPKFVTGLKFDRSEWKIDGKAVSRNGIVLGDLSKGRHRLEISLFKGRNAVAKKSVEFVIED